MNWIIAAMVVLVTMGAGLVALAVFGARAAGEAAAEQRDEMTPRDEYDAN